MHHRGVHYDTGTIFRGPGYAISTRRGTPAPALVRRELQIIRDDLHANAVRITGSHVERLTSTARSALDLGLEVWYSPAIYGQTTQETGDRLVAAAEHAAALADAHRGRLVFVAGSEHTLFMRDLIPGKDIRARLAGLKAGFGAGGKLPGTDVLNAFLHDVAARLRDVCSAPLTYTALPFEQVEWEPFDFIGVDHYRDERVKERYVEMLAPYLATGKPVIVTEFGMRTYHGAESSGALGFGVEDNLRLYLHTRPIIGPLFKRRLNNVYMRDEAMQAREIGETLDALERAGVAGALLSSFASPGATFDEDPRYDVDMNTP